MIKIILYQGYNKNWFGCMQGEMRQKLR